MDRPRPVRGGQRLNTLLHREQPDGFIRPGAEHFGATEVLMHAFTDWDRVISELGFDPR